MKFNTFRNLLIAGLIGAPVAGLAAWALLGDDSPPSAPSVAGPRPTATTAAPSAAPPAATAAPSTAAAHERYLLQTLGQPASSDKQKDAVRGAIKVNVYNEGGVWGRAKVDLDRDEQWDEKWTLKGGAIEKQVAPADDDNYTERYVHGPSGWTRK